MLVGRGPGIPLKAVAVDGVSFEFSQVGRSVLFWNFSVGGSRIGNRAAQLDASIRAGRLYRSAYSMGLGAAGLTFFDDG